MKKKEKLAQEQIRLLLQQNTPPDIAPMAEQRLTAKLNQDIQTMDYCDPQTLPEIILTHASHLSPWIWLVQTGFLIMLFIFAFMGDRKQVYVYMLFLAPGLILILLWELSKTFSHNMWELEASCRYNLAQLFFFRLCILSGTDFLVLGSALAAFRMAGGLLWQFALCVLLPFFLSASLCLWTLRHFGNRVNRSGLAAACMMMFVLWMPLLSEITIMDSFYDSSAVAASAAYLAWLPDVVLGATLIALVLFLVNAFRLCTKKYYETNRIVHL